MRQIFTTFPYIEPAIPLSFANAMRAASRLVELKTGDILKLPAELHHCYLIEEGVAGYFIAGVFGESRIMGLLPPGRSVADISVSIGRSCNIETRALTPLKAWACPAKFFDEVVFADRTLSEIHHRLTVMKFESIVEGMVANLTLPPEERLKMLLFMLTAEESGVEEKEWRTLPYRLTAQELGQVVSITRSNISRQLNAWRKEGLAEKDGLVWRFKSALFESVYDWKLDGVAPTTPKNLTRALALASTVELSGKKETRSVPSLDEAIEVALSELC